MDTFFDFVASGWFEWMVLPLVIVLLTGFAKSDARIVPDESRNRLAVGIEVSIGAIFALAVHWGILIANPDLSPVVVDPTGIGMPLVLIGLVFGLWMITRLVRKRGWATDMELNLTGVWVQNLWGLGTLGLVAAVIGVAS